MALNFTQIFTNLGVLIGRSNSYASLATTTLPADETLIIQTIPTGGSGFGNQQSPISGLTGSYSGFQGQVVGWRTTLDGYFVKVLTDQDTVLSQLSGLTGTDKTTVLKALIQAMSDNTQTVKGNTVVVGSVTAGPGNTGSGTPILDTILDGFSIPVSGGFSHLTYLGQASQLAVPSETMTLTCTNASTEGAEQWTWAGGQKWPILDFHPEGSGSLSNVTTANNGSSIVQNLSFNSFSGNTPTGWTVISGTPGTTIFAETGSSNIFRGTNSLRLTGNGAQSPQIQQTLGVGRMNPRQRYLLTLQLKASGPVGAGSLLITWSGTGYSAAPGEQINVTLASIPGTFTKYQFFLNAPATIPSNWALNIQNTGAPIGNTGNVWLSSGSFNAVNWGGGINCSVIAGQTPFIVGDRFSWPVTNTTTGLFQDYLRRTEFAQFPFVLNGSQTINDSLA